MLQGLRLPLLLAFSVAAMPPPLPEQCESEMNKIKDLLQVSCVEKGLTSIPAGLPKDTGILLLGANLLAEVATASFGHLEQLSELDLSNNSLHTLETSSPLPQLQQCLLSHNALERLPVWQGLPSLTRLALGHNLLAQLPEGGFRHLRRLQDLELQGNRLRSLPAGAFRGLGDLKDLDLSENLLEALPRELLAELRNLEMLRLERNRLQHLPEGFFAKKVFYVYVYLAENPWLCDCQLQYLRDWILENEISVYTRTLVWEHGSQKMSTENKPESVQCHAPAQEQGRPVMHFQAACRKQGDGADPEEGEVHGVPPTQETTTTGPPTSSTWMLSPTAHRTMLPSAPPSWPMSLAPSNSSTAPHPPPSPTPTPAASVRSPTTIRGLPTSPPTPPPPIPLPVSTSAPATSLVPAQMPPSITSNIPAAQPTMPRAHSSLPPGRITAPMLPALPESPPPTEAAAIRLSPSTVAPLLSTLPAEPPCRTAAVAGSPLPACLCPALPVRVLGEGGRQGSPASWLAGFCCPLRLALYLACLGLGALPALAILCALEWVCLHWDHPAWPRAVEPHPVQYQQMPKALLEGQWQETDRAPKPRTSPQLYRACMTLRVAPQRHVSWLLVSLPGPARKWPGKPRPSSLDQSQEALGAVGAKDAAASL